MNATAGSASETSEAAPDGDASRLRFRSMFRNATTGSVATGFVVQSGLVISGPLVARMLGVESRGELAMLVLWPSILSHVVGGGFPLAITYQIARRGALPRSLAARAAGIALGQAMLVVLLHAGILALVLRHAGPDIRTAGVMMLALGPSMLAQQYGLAILQGQGSFRHFNAVRLIHPLVYPASVAALFFAGSESIVLVAAVGVVTSAALGVAALGLALARLELSREAPHEERTLAAIWFGLRGLPGNVSPIDALRLDQLVIALFFPASALGIYAVGAAFTNAPRFAALSVGLVAYPSVAARRDPAHARRTMWSYVWIAAALGLAIVIPLELLAPTLVPLFFGTEFSDAATVMQLLMPGLALMGARRALAEGLRGRGHPGAGTVAEATSWGVLGVGFAALAPLWGVNGIALAMSLTQFAAFAALLVAARALGELRTGEVKAAPRAAWRSLRPTGARPPASRARISERGTEPEARGGSKP